MNDKELLELERDYAVDVCKAVMQDQADLKAENHKLRKAIDSEMLRQLRHYTICHLMNFPNCGAPTEAEIDAALSAFPKSEEPLTEDEIISMARIASLENLYKDGRFIGAEFTRGGILAFAHAIKSPPPKD